MTLLNTTPQAVTLNGWALADRFKNKQTLNGTLAAGATLVVNVQTPVQLGNQSFLETETLITKLMGKGEAAARRELMELHGDAVEIDI